MNAKKTKCLVLSVSLLFQSIFVVFQVPVLAKDTKGDNLKMFEKQLNDAGKDVPLEREVRWLKRI